jgi:hypothetical protein
VSNQELLQWVHWASDSVTTYYGRYAVPSVLVRIIPSSGRGVRGGKTFGRDDGGFIRIHVGSETTMAGFTSDWMLTHEMVHLAFPSVAANHHWIEEGIATYVEPIARVRARHLDAHEMWFELVRVLHQGLPEPGDGGLDYTHTLGAHLLGRRALLLSRRRRNPQAHEQPQWPRRRSARNPACRWGHTPRLGVDESAEHRRSVNGCFGSDSALRQDERQAVRRGSARHVEGIGVERESETVRFIDSAPLAATRRAITYGEEDSSSKLCNRRIREHSHCRARREFSTLKRRRVLSSGARKLAGVSACTWSIGEV